MKQDICADCHDEVGNHKVFRFDEYEDGKPVMMCDICYQKHEENGDWVA